MTNITELWPSRVIWFMWVPDAYDQARIRGEQLLLSGRCPMHCALRALEEARSRLSEAIYNLDLSTIHNTLSTCRCQVTFERHPLWAFLKIHTKARTRYVDPPHSDITARGTWMSMNFPTGIGEDETP